MKTAKENFEILDNQKKIKRGNKELKKIQQNCKEKINIKDGGKTL